MTENGPDAAPGSTDGPEGVFGNLPSTRPGSRSPRRRHAEAEKGSQGTEPEAAEPAPEPKPEPEPEPEPVSQTQAPEPEPPQPSEDPLAPQPSIQGVEDLAWAGVAVVAQAATAGIRFTSKALEAARKSIDRP
jgi:outer membrane biosynthesis protein TonB